MKAAYFYPATRAQKMQGTRGVYELHDIAHGESRIFACHNVANKAEARRRAAADDATPWNF